MSIERTVIEHYDREGMAERILEQARAEAADPAHLTTADLAPYDDMHVGGRKASAHLMERLGFEPGMKVLDIGSGLGGPARFAAEAYGIHVTGIDLTPGYREVSGKLSEATGLGGVTEFVTGSALAMPFGDGAFDAAYMIHVGMNIQDKRGLYREAHRVLKPGARFGIYDMMAGQDNVSLAFPLPWADGQGSSFVLTPREIAGLLAQAGFEVEDTENRRDFALAVLEKRLEHPSFRARTDDFPLRVRNLVANIRGGLCAPWQIVSRRP